MGMPEWLLLLVAEEADVRTLASLMRTCKGAHHLIITYERSISKRLLAKAPLSPTCDVLSTQKPDQEVLPRLSFDTLRELQRRDERIGHVVGGAFLFENELIPSHGRTRYLAGLQRAVRLCDCIADLRTEPFGSSPGAPRFAAALREAQVRFIKTLPVVDLAFLAELASMCGTGWARTKGSALETDPDAWDKVLAFEELVLRRGSLLLWGCAHGPESLREYVGQEVNRVAEEIREWESGLSERLPSLRMTVVNRFMEHQKCDFAEAWKQQSVLVVKECDKIC